MDPLIDSCSCDTQAPDQHGELLQCRTKYRYLDIVLEQKVVSTSQIYSYPLRLSPQYVGTLKDGTFSLSLSFAPKKSEYFLEISIEFFYICTLYHKVSAQWLILDDKYSFLVE